MELDDAERTGVTKWQDYQNPLARLLMLMMMIDDDENDADVGILYQVKIFSKAWSHVKSVV